MPSDAKRTRILTLLDQGLLTQSEAATLLGVSRQAVHRWVKLARLTPGLSRQRYLRELLRGSA